MNKLTMLVGVPGSGKSRFANRVPDCIVLNMDCIREEILGDAACQAHGSLIGLLLEARLFNALRSGRDIVLDNTNIYAKFRKPIIEKAIEAGYTVEIAFIDTELDTCLLRNRNRFRQVPESVILRMYEALQKPENIPCLKNDGVKVRDYGDRVLI